MGKINKVHLVYPVGNKISTPEAIGRHLKNYLEKNYEVKTYNYDQYKIISPGSSDVLIGHWHPNPFTVFRLSAQKIGWKRIIALSPFCPDKTAWQNAFANKIIEKCDRYLAITGNSWMACLKNSPFWHWEPKIVHLDLAVNRADFPFIKENFNQVKKRRFLYIGHTGWYKNIELLEKIALKLPETEFAWMGGNQILKNIKTLGKNDFSSQEAKNLIQEYDFMITLGSADANPTTILEAMAWGLIPVCSVQSGYIGFPSIRNISIDCIDDSLKTIKHLQSVPDEQLKKWQNENLTELDKHFNWDRFCEQVLYEIENENSPHLNETNLKQRLELFFAEFRSPMFWGRPDNFYKFLKANFKYTFHNKL